VQLDSFDGVWVDEERMMSWLWIVSLRGSTACLFVGLPFAYFFHEADGLFTANRFAKRLVAALVEVLMFGVIVVGIAFVLQVGRPRHTTITSPCRPRVCGTDVCTLYVQSFAGSRYDALTFPLTILSAVEIIPGLLICMIAAPVSVSVAVAVTVSPRTIAQRSDVIVHVASQVGVLRMLKGLLARLVADPDAERQLQELADMYVHEYVCASCLYDV
jgi:hypothetical protein